MRPLVRRWARVGGIGVGIAAVLLSTPLAHAVLGGDASTIDDDTTRLKGVRGPGMRLQSASVAQVQVHVISMADGSSIREFVAPNGAVFGVAWSTRFKPNLEALLGAHAGTFAGAAAEAARAPGVKRNVVLERGDLVVHSTSHLNSFVGKAYLKSRIPQGVRIDELR